MKPMRLLLSLGTAWLVAATLAGCGGGSPGIPDTIYFRLPPRAAAARLAKPLPQPILVETLLADGLQSDQAIIYSLDPDGARLKAYHYQLWVDPPVRLLQRRLIATLRDAGASELVADRLPHQVDALRISGRLERFERIKTASGWQVAVALALRAERREGGTPLVLREYSEQLPAGETLRDSVATMGQAVDRIFAEFLRDLAAAGDA
jgi:cholesterol transport system auxiliary component